MTFMLSALLLGAMQTAEPLRIEPHWDGSHCSTRIDGAPVTGEVMERVVKRAAQHGRPITVINGMDIPYRCIGGTIFTLQAGGYRGSANIGPSPTYAMQMHTTVRFGVAPGACAFLVNDESVAEIDLMALMADWKRYGTQIHVQPDANAEYRCVDAGLALIKRAGLTNLGFVGNDPYAPDAPM